MVSLWIDLVAGFQRQVPRLAIAGVAALLCCRALPELPPPGWDEAEHLGLPAVVLFDRLQHGELASAAHALLGQEQVPPGAALAILPIFWFGAPDWSTARAAVVLLFALLSLFAGAIADHLSGSRETTRAGWIAQGLVLASPAAIGLSRSLFLEVPFAALASAGTLLYVKLERRELEGLPPGRPRTLALYLLPGALLAWACFAKWSYGALLAAALVVERAAAYRARSDDASRSLRASAYLIGPLAVASAWWFLLPWPGEVLAVGAAHRHAFASYLTEARAAGVDWAGVALYAGWYHHLSPAVFFGVALLVAAAAMHRGRPGMRWVALIAAVELGAVLLHPFKLSRLFLPGFAFLWILAGAGFHALTRGWRTPLKAIAVLASAFLALLSSGRGLLPPQRFGLGAVPEEVLADWRSAYASRKVEASGPEGLSALAERISELVPESAELRCVRTGHELSDAALAWSLYLSRRSDPRAGAAPRAPAREQGERFDVARIGAMPAWGAASGAALREHAESWLAPAAAVVMLDPGYARGETFRLEAQPFSARWYDHVREVLPRLGFTKELAEERFAFSRRRASVGLEIWIREGPRP